MQELTLAVVGIDFPNADRSNRRSEAMMTLPGAPVALVSEPKNKHDPNAVAVISPQGVQLGYLTAERAPYINARISRGEPVSAIFQGMEGGVAFIRVRFGGGFPTLPPLSDETPPPLRPDCGSESFDLHGFQPDEDGPEWGA
jgi:hypothetical protein